MLVEKRQFAGEDVPAFTTAEASIATFGAGELGWLN